MPSKKAPSQRERGEEAPALPALEARCAVVAAARLDEVFALVVVVQTAEEAHQGVFVLTAAYLHAFFAVGALAHEVQVVERFGEQVVTRCGHVLEEFGLPVEADHRLEVVVPGEGAFERAVEVGLIVGVGHALFIEFVLHLSGRERVYFTRILRVLGVDLTVGVARGIEHVGEVTLDLQPFDRMAAGEKQQCGCKNRIRKEVFFHDFRVLVPRKIRRFSDGSVFVGKRECRKE